MTEALKISASEATPGDKAEFPGMVTEDGKPWHYLDSAATAQKPQIVLDSMAWALGEGYATVHRGVYSRSARMTMGYEAARRRVAAFISASQDELIFTRGATEAINLVAYSYPKKGRVLLSQLEHHSNIVPWQLAGWQVDVCPLTEDGRIDLDAAEKMLTPEHEMVAFAHVSNVLGSVLDAPRAADLAHSVGAKLLLDGCQAAPRLPVYVDEIGCDFYAMSAHKMYGPTGVGALWGRKALLEEMPPWQGGGSMIDKVTFAETTYAPPPQRFEAGTPAIAEAYAFAEACDFIDQIGRETIEAHERALVRQLREELGRIQGVRLFGPEDALGIVSFELPGVHPHDLGTILDEENVAIRAGHHCCQPLMDHLGVPGTARASFGVYSDESDIAALMRGIDRTLKIFA
ncbi:cysteine desulfurase [Alteriqipengyuania sp. NZ-12B]|uniref:cysteine desulfurase n=1 Tax=Alteriqipengyuania abyssalis TaxID=2860200 RepID=A0ABS7PC66_9SPHN|nr:cysteine desulfurase [Alteriqipengyuania abyssalis]MBY8336576.1 cysteine desulfurase [Alteriqipengyuania abyssalis]